jgi:hypothetical protein
MSLLSEVSATIINTNGISINNNNTANGLGDLQLADLSNAQANNVLTFNLDTKLWEAQPVKTLQNTPIADLSALVNGDILAWNSATSQWVPQVPGTSNNVFVTNDTSTSTDLYPVFVSTTGSVPLKADTSSLKFNPSLSLLTVDNLIANLAGGAAGQLVYQNNNNLTDFLDVGQSNQVLKSNGAGAAPAWVDQSTLSVGSATTATTATKASAVSGTASSQLLIQTGTDTTSFFSSGNLTQVLRSNGAGAAPAWVDQSTLSVGRLPQLPLLPKPTT